MDGIGDVCDVVSAPDPFQSRRADCALWCHGVYCCLLARGITSDVFTSPSTEGGVAGDLQEYVKRILVCYETGHTMSTDPFSAHGEPG